MRAERGKNLVGKWTVLQSRPEEQHARWRCNTHSLASDKKKLNLGRDILVGLRFSEFCGVQQIPGPIRYPPFDYTTTRDVARSYTTREHIFSGTTNKPQEPGIF